MPVLVVMGLCCDVVVCALGQFLRQASALVHEGSRCLSARYGIQTPASNSVVLIRHNENKKINAEQGL